MTTGNFLVVLHERNGQLSLSTRRAFETREDAEHYASSVYAGYSPEVVECLRPIMVGRPEEDQKTLEAAVNAFGDVPCLVHYRDGEFHQTCARCEQYAALRAVAGLGTR